ncbi:MAG: dienelactone hydrolase family protein [Bryobacteraceae bacterium]
MKIRLVAVTAAVILIGGAAWHRVATSTPKTVAGVALPGLPSEAEAREMLNNTTRHREWVNLAIGDSGMRVFVAYPGRADNAPVVIMTDKTQSASEWLRGAAIKVADEGYIAVVPDLLSGMAPGGRDADSFANRDAIAQALASMSKDDETRRIAAARDYALTLPAANGQSAALEFDAASGKVQAFVEKPIAGESSSRFDLKANEWTNAVAFLTKQTNNHPITGENPNMPMDHSMHMGMSGMEHAGMAMAQDAANTKKAAGPRGYPAGKLPDLPAGTFNAHTTILDSKLKKEFVDIPYGDLKLHTWVEYPAGEGKAPVVMVMQHGPGMDDWQRALADQLAQQGFIAVAVDLHSGLGPNGGAYESFRGTDEVMRATARINQDEMQKRYKAGFEWAKKLPRWNGRSASIGFCMGGGNSFRFAGEVPEVNAAVSYYGNNPSEELMSKIKAPVLAFYGEEDARVTAGAEPAANTMKKLGKSFEHHIYPHATHGFLEFQDLAGNPTATSDSWAKTIDFLKKYTM